MSRITCDVCLGARRLAGEPCERCRGTGLIERPATDVLPQEELDRLARYRDRHLRADLERTTRVLPEDEPGD